MNLHTKKYLASLCLTVIFSISGLVNVSFAGEFEQLESCYHCHGEDGASTEPEIPSIGGLSAPYIIDTMLTYRNDERPCQETEFPVGPRKGEKTDMCVTARDLSEAQTEEIAEHLAKEPFVRAKQDFDPEKAKPGKIVHNRLCKKCHEDAGASPDDDAGILAGQWMPYMEQQMEEYLTGKRPMPKKMKIKMDKLDKTDTENLIHYYGSFQ